MLVLYVPIIVLGALAAFFAIFSLIAGHVSGPHRWNRARSCRDPPVCISSIAQQASPNVAGQTDTLRA